MMATLGLDGLNDETNNAFMNLKYYEKTTMF